MGQKQTKNVYTGMCTEKKTVLWTIKNFDIIRKSSELISLQKLDIKAGDSLGITSDWRFDMRVFEDNTQPTGKNKTLAFFLQLIKAPANCEWLNAQYRVKIKSNLGFVLINTKAEMHKYLAGESYGWNKFLSQEQLATIPLMNGDLKIELVLTIAYPGIFSNAVKDIENPAKLNFAEKLQKDMAQLLDKKLIESGDGAVKLISNDDKEFSANRNILAARSPVFLTMFQTKMTESETGIVHIRELSSKTLKILLQYFYTGTLHEDWSSQDVTAELVYAAGKYQLSDLLEFFDENLGKVCSKQNVARLLNVAGNLSLNTAKEELLDFMKLHIFDLEEMVNFVCEIENEELNSLNAK